MDAIENFRVIRLETTDSTNLYLERLISQKEAEDGLIIMASDQSEGRGQRGTKWHSEPGKNLTFSFLLKPHFLNVARQFMISKVIALSVLELLKELLPGRDIRIKWPNDIMVSDRKISGILITAQIKENRIENVIAGIGININQSEFISEIPNPTSLILHTAKETNLDYCLNLWMEKFKWYYGLLQQGASEYINDKYLENLYRLNVEAHYLYQGKKIMGKIKGVSEEGLLQISVEGNRLILCDTKELVYLY